MKTNPKVGDLYVIPLSSGGYARALLTHTWEDEPNSAFFWFYAPRIFEIPSHFELPADSEAVDKSENVLAEIKKGIWHKVASFGESVSLASHPIPLMRHSVLQPEVVVLDKSKLYTGPPFRSCPKHIDPWSLRVYGVAGPGATASFLDRIL